MLRHDEWRAREAAHQLRADALTAAHRARKQRGERHPVEDFLWTYYSVKPGELRRWHPGAAAVLEGGARRPLERHAHGGGRTTDERTTGGRDAQLGRRAPGRR
jgi:hypothetical protein